MPLGAAENIFLDTNWEYDDINAETFIEILDNMFLFFSWKLETMKLIYSWIPSSGCESLYQTNKISLTIKFEKPGKGE